MTNFIDAFAFYIHTVFFGKAPPEQIALATSEAAWPVSLFGWVRSQKKVYRLSFFHPRRSGNVFLRLLYISRMAGWPDHIRKSRSR
jgi:hypothetical protein